MFVSAKINQALFIEHPPNNSNALQGDLQEITQKRDFKAKKGLETKKHLQTKAHHEDIKVTNKNKNWKMLR